MLTSFHLKACLRRTSLMISGKRRQVTFCPYCGVTNDNAETGLNNIRKHLDVMLVCGGCHTKSVCLGQALQKHMKDNCPAVLAILGRPGAAGNKSSPTIRGSVERNRGNIPSFCYSGIKLVKHLNKDLRLNLLRSLIYNET